MQHQLEKAGRSTSRTTADGRLFTTHQRDDLRWIYRIDGKASEKTYPTAGEAERGALLGLAAMAKANRDESWKIKIIWAVVLAPLAYFLVFLVRMFLLG